MTNESIDFNANYAEPKISPEGVYYGEPRARMVFPDLKTAADFINHGRTDNPFPGGPASADSLTEVREAPTGEHSQYDAFVTRPDRETGEVGMLLRRYGTHDLAAHKKFRNFVTKTANGYGRNRSAIN